MANSSIVAGFSRMWEHVLLLFDGHTHDEVKFVPQSLTSEQKAQARVNIEAISIQIGTELPETLEEGQFFGLIEE